MFFFELANTTLLYQSHGNVSQSTTSSSNSTTVTSASTRSSPSVSTVPKALTVGMQIFRKSLDSLHPSVAGVFQFLTALFKKDLSYSSLNTARSALSTIITVDGMPIGSHPLVVRFLKGVFNLRPPVPRYKEVWDVSIVLRFLKTLSPVASLSLRSLTLKLVMLLSLVTAQRGQTFHLLDINLMSIYDSSIVFTFNKPLKQSNPRTQVKPLVLKAYDESLWVFFYLKRVPSLNRDFSCYWFPIVDPFSETS